MVIYLIIGVLVGLVVGIAIDRKNRQEKDSRVPSDKDKNKILNIRKDKITNNDVEEKLKVSDSTAERYLERMVEQGLLKRHGKTRGIYYTKNIG